MRVTKMPCLQAPAKKMRRLGAQTARYDRLPLVFIQATIARALGSANVSLLEKCAADLRKKPGTQALRLPQGSPTPDLPAHPGSVLVLMFMSGLRVSRLQHQGFGVSAELRVTTPLRAVRVAASETSDRIRGSGVDGARKSRQSGQSGQSRTWT